LFENKNIQLLNKSRFAEKKTEIVQHVAKNAVNSRVA